MKLLTTSQPVARVADPELQRTSCAATDSPSTDAPELTWNFEKFLVNRKGQVVARFAPDTLPTDPAV